MTGAASLQIYANIGGKSLGLRIPTEIPPELSFLWPVLVLA